MLQLEVCVLCVFLAFRQLFQIGVLQQPLLASSAGETPVFSFLVLPSSLV